ncbi:MAG: hypothetical protein V3W31_06210 [Thermodesulfobacteriota bacterium]
MKKDVMVSLLLVEEEDGTWTGYCPDLNTNSTGKDPESTVVNLRAVTEEHIKKVGFENMQLKAVKCLKMKVNG